MYRIFFFLTVLGCVSLHGSGQGMYSFTRHGMDHELASNEVRSFLQDDRGDLWTGTVNGLQRYNGSFIQQSKLGDTKRAIPYCIDQVITDKHHNIWILTEGKVGIVDKVDFKVTYIPFVGKAAKKLWLNNEGDVFLIVDFSNVYKYSFSQNRFTTSLPFTIPAKWTINTLYQEKGSGNYWVGSDSGLAKYDIQKHALYYSYIHPVADAFLSSREARLPIHAFSIDTQGNYWLINDHYGVKELHYYDAVQSRNQQVLMPEIKGDQEPRDLYIDNQGSIWLYGDNLLYQYDVATHHWNFIRSSDDFRGIRYNVVFQVAEDNLKNIWFATNKGLYMLSQQSRNKQLFQLPDDKQNAPILAFTAWHHQYLAGTWGKGVVAYDSLFNKTNLSFDIPAKSPYQFVWFMQPDKNNQGIWIGCQDGYLMYASKAGNRYYHLPVFNGKTINQMIGAGNATWFGTVGGRLIRFNREKNSFDLIQQFDSRINKLCALPGGNISVGTAQSGLYIFDPKANRIIDHYSVSNGLYGNYVSDIAIFNDSTLFVAAKGLHIIHSNNKRVERYCAENGYPFNNLNKVYKDKSNILWLVTSDLLYRFDYSHHRFDKYGEAHGFTNLADVDQVITQLPDGRLLLAGTNKLLRFDPAGINARIAPTKVNINAFKIGDELLPVDSLLQLDVINLPLQRGSFAVYFSSPTYTAEANNLQVQYKLEGIEDNWNTTGVTGVAQYSKQLRSGMYTFLIRTIDENGKTSEPNRLTIRLNMPFWRTKWGLLVIGLVIAAQGLWFYRQRLIKRKAVEKMRTKVARDLHDDIGSTLTTISVLTQHARNKIELTGDHRKIVDTIYDNSTQMMEAMDDIVWSINPKHDTIQQITARMREFAVMLFEAKEIEYSFHVQESILKAKLNMEVRKDLFLIFKEAINNLVKYSGCSFASVSIYKKDNCLVMHIQDNGRGFDPNRPTSRNGVSNMSNRAKAIGARFTVKSDQQNGTSIELQLPIKL